MRKQARLAARFLQTPWLTGIRETGKTHAPVSPSDAAPYRVERDGPPPGRGGPLPTAASRLPRADPSAQPQDLPAVTLRLPWIPLLLSALLAAPRAHAADLPVHDDAIRTPDDLRGKRVGLVIGSMYEPQVRARVPDVQAVFFDDIPSQLPALRQGRIDAFILDHTLAGVLLENAPGLRILDGSLGSAPIAMLFPKNATVDHVAPVNAALADLRREGVLDQLEARWLAMGAPRVPSDPLPQTTDENAPPLRVGVVDTMMPFVYRGENGRLVGFDIELVHHLAARLRRRPVFTVYSFGGLLATLPSGREDMLISSLTVTEERGRHAHFSDPYLRNNVIVVARDRRAAHAVPAFASVDDLVGKRIGFLLGSVYEHLARRRIPSFEAVPSNDNGPLLLALRTRRVDAVLAERGLAESILRTHPDLAIMDETIGQVEISLALPRGHPHRDALNRAIDDFERDGTLRAMRDRWFGPRDQRKMPGDLPVAENPDGVWRVGSACSDDPFTYIGAGGQPLGLDIELVHRLAHRLNLRLELTPTYTWDGLLAAVQAGHEDAIANSVTVTPERARHMDFTRPYLRADVVALTRAVPPDAARRTWAGWWASVVDSFRSNFIVEQRYRLIVHGLAVTLLVTVAASLLGVALGVPLCFALRSRRAWIQRPARAYIDILQGTPVLVLLMVLFYVVLAGVPIHAVAVAILGFALNFAAYSAEIFRSAIAAVPGGQYESARAMGFGHAAAFVHVILPQALRHALPVLRGEILSMMKMTSIVGYISIHDLTRAGEIIRSRTFQPFFSLIAIALIYYALARLLVFVLQRFEQRRDAAPAEPGATSLD